MSQKRAIIVHGWGGKPGEHWAPWLRTQLEQIGYEVIEPAMPHTNEPKIAEWVAQLESTVGNITEDTYFVGHSVGCQAIMRYLETQVGKKAGGCIFVAGWFKLANLEDEEEERIAEPWVQDDIDFTKILGVTKNFAVINSSNDDYNYVEENKEMFTSNLGADVRILPNKGHFTTGDGVTELPEVIEALRKIEL